MLIYIIHGHNLIVGLQVVQSMKFACTSKKTSPQVQWFGGGPLESCDF